MCYDFSTATKLLNVFGSLKREYDGDLWRLYLASRDGYDLEERLRALRKGIGDTTISIFLRDMRPIWVKANPPPTPLVRMGMEELGIQDLKLCAEQWGLSRVRLETSLFRLANDHLKNGKRCRVP